MKQLFLNTVILLLLIPAITTAQENAGPKKNKIGVYFMTPNPVHQTDFERNLARHIKEFHTGRSAVDIYEGLVGNRTGHFFMGDRAPSSWAEVEANNDVRQKDHSTDWEKNISIYLSKEGPYQIYELSDDSFIPASMADMPNVDKWGVYFIDINQGMEEDFFAGIKKIKEIYQKNSSKEYYYIFTRVFGNGTQVAVNFPLTKGMASFEPDPNTELANMFKKAFPKEDYKAWFKKFISTNKSFESMVMLHRKDLSSPQN
jgi:hypothetical protein